MSWSDAPGVPKYKGITPLAAGVLGVLGLLGGGLLGYGLYQYCRPRQRRGSSPHEPRHTPDPPSGWSDSALKLPGSPEGA